MNQSRPKEKTTKIQTSVSNRVTVRNPNTPESSSTVDAVKYNAMKDALLQVLPHQSPGLTGAEIYDAVLSCLSQEIFPGGAKAGWWIKCVQLDMEAQNIIARETTKPLRWHQK